MRCRSSGRTRRRAQQATAPACHVSSLGKLQLSHIDEMNRADVTEIVSLPVITASEQQDLQAACMETTAPDLV